MYDGSRVCVGCYIASFPKVFLTTLNRRRGIRHHASFLLLIIGVRMGFNRVCSGISAKRNMRKSTLLALLVCFTAIGLFSSCEKEKEDDSVTMVTSTGVTYELNGTSWKTIGNDDVEYFLFFTSNNNGNLQEGTRTPFDFVYSIEGSYGVVSFSDEQVLDIHNFYDISLSLELHLLTKDKLSLGGAVFTRL